MFESIIFDIYHFAYHIIDYEEIRYFPCNCLCCFILLSWTNKRNTHIELKQVLLLIVRKTKFKKTDMITKVSKAWANWKYAVIFLIEIWKQQQQVRYGVLVEYKINMSQ